MEFFMVRYNHLEHRSIGFPGKEWDVYQKMVIVGTVFKVQPPSYASWFNHRYYYHKPKETSRCEPFLLVKQQFCCSNFHLSWFKHRFLLHKRPCLLLKHQFLLQNPTCLLANPSLLVNPPLLLKPSIFAAEIHNWLVVWNHGIL